MVSPVLEHANLDVPSIESTTRFLLTAFPDFCVRGQGNSAEFGPWAHVGNERFYIALQETPTHSISNNTSPLRHLGWVIDDVERLIKRLASIGIHPSDSDWLDSHPYRRRVYFEDDNRLQWEFIQYLSDSPQQRNDYSL